MVLKGFLRVYLGLAALGACTSALFLVATPQSSGAQAVSSIGTLTANSGETPANLTCMVGGIATGGVPAPTGSVTFKDLTESQTLGTATLTGPGEYSLQPLAARSASVSGANNGSEPNDMATGDFNGDGIPDIAFTYQTVGYDWVAVRLGIGDGTFQAPTTVNLGSWNNTDLTPIVADMNGDGKPDLVIASEGSSTSYTTYITVLLGNGDGTFQAPILDSFTIGNTLGIAVGDFNGDGKMDVAVATNGISTQNVWILLGDGRGGFSTPSQNSAYQGNAGPGGKIFAADLRNDGKLDLIFVPSSGVPQILLGNGDGTFAAAQPLSPGQANSFAVGDFNGDGIPDIATNFMTGSVVDWTVRGQIHILLGNGDGTFASGSTYSYTYSFSANWNPMTLFTGDFHGNGHLDLLLFEKSSPAFLYTGAGDGTFQPAGQFTLAVDGIVPGVFFSAGAHAAQSLAYVLFKSSVVGTIIPMQSESATLRPFSLSPVDPATHSLQCSYGGDSNYSASDSLAVSYTIPPAAVPLIQPNGGAFTPPFNVAITDATPGATIHYTTDGTIPTASSPVYNGLLKLTSSATVTAVASAPGFSLSPVASATFTLQSRTAAPVISPSTGTYTGTQNVTITDADGSATIYYTTDGTTPTAASTTYAGSFPVSTASTVQAIAVANGFANSLSTSAIYTFKNASMSLSLTGSDPYTMTCSVAGPAQFSSSGPTGTVTFTDTTTGVTLGTAPLGTALSIQGLQSLSTNLVDTAGNAFNEMAAADFDGDGKVDLVWSDKSMLHISLGNGDDTFQPATTIDANLVVAGIAAGDFNGDGKMDLAVADDLTKAVAIFLGNGDGTFQAPVTYAAGAMPAGIVAADFGNGKLDLAVTDSTGNVVWLLLGNGDGTFQAPASYPTGNGPHAIVTGEFTGQGHLDLAIRNQGDKSVSILPGNGDGTFGAQIVSTNGQAGSGLAAADLNHDGRFDLAMSNGSMSVAVLLGNGDGTFQSSPSLVISYNTPVNDVAIGDVNGDGIPDLAVSGYGSDAVLIALGKGDGTFGASTAVPAASLDGAQNVAVANFAGGTTAQIVAGLDAYRTDVMSAADGFQVFGYTDTLGAQAKLSNVNVALNSIATHKFLCTYPGDSNYSGGTAAASETYTNLPAPVFSLLVGVYNAPQTVSITDAKGSAAIYYTTDGSTPTVNSTKYTGPIPVSTTTKFKAIAVNSGYLDSAISEAVYTLASTPSFTPPAGSYTSAQQVTIADTTPSAAVYYTTDGTAPTVKSTRYSSPVKLTGQTTLQAIAVAPGYLNSAVSSGSYVAGSPASTTTTLQASTQNAVAGQQVTLTAAVAGNSPTGAVTFTANGTRLGTGTVSSGNASLKTSFATAGTYSVTAAYGGDGANAASTSSSINIVVVSADYSLQAQPQSATISAGQTATFKISVIATGGYSGAVEFSCGTLPSSASCSFSPTSVNPAGGTATDTLTISTTAPTASKNNNPPLPGSVSGTVALAGLVGLIFAPVSKRRWRKYLRGVSLGLLAVACITMSIGCGGGGGSSSGGGGGQSNAGTPAGTYSVSVSASATGGAQHSLNISLIVQ